MNLPKGRRRAKLEISAKVWDTRQHARCNSFNAHEDYVSDLTYMPDTKEILGTSGDGTLSVCSLKKKKVKSQSKFLKDELLSVVVMKVICGTQTGALLLYSWGYFEDCSDRFVGHPMSVDTLLKVKLNCKSFLFKQTCVVNIFFLNSM